MYNSTRGCEKVTSSQAIINGIANNGGLYVKEETEKITSTDLYKYLKLSYQELATVIFKYYFNNLENTNKIVNNAYKDTFDSQEIVKVKKTNSCYFLELYHGKTLAFKDVALSALPLLMKESKRIEKNNEKTIILTATSGDTGSAALCGFNNNTDTKMVVIYPTIGVSTIQEKQMLSFASKYQRVISLEGNFDDAQSLVKQIFCDKNLKLYSPKYVLSSANSINIGRLVPQIVYYFYSYFNLVNNKEINFLDKINFVVPTGNFGNILACYMAKMMGLPINKLICASNENNVLTDFFCQHIYDKNRKFIKTSSPSMDILISSNLERLLYYVYKDSSIVKKYMDELLDTGKYTIPESDYHLFNDFYGVYCTEKETKNAISEVYRNDNYLIDPHTAVAYYGYKKYLQKTKDSTKTIIVSTASPFKFPVIVSKALKIYEDIDDFLLVKKISKFTNIEYPKIVDEINKNYSKIVWSKNESYKKMCELLQELNNE